MSKEYSKRSWNNMTGTVLAVFIVLAVNASGPAAPLSDEAQTAMAVLQSEYPGVEFYTPGARVTGVYGVPFAFGGSPVESAEKFVREHIGLFGTKAELLVPGNTFNDVFVQPVMYQADKADYKFWLVYYRQVVNDIPVFRAEARFLMLNKESYPLVLAVSDLRDLGEYHPPEPGGEPGDRGHAEALALVPGLVSFGPSSWIIWAGVDEMVVEPRLAVQFIADNKRQAEGDYEEWLFIADAETGKILYQEDRVLEIEQNVWGRATTGPKSDTCGPEPLNPPAPMPYARVNVGGVDIYTDATGLFITTYQGPYPVTVSSPIEGYWFNVNNVGGTDTVLTMSVASADDWDDILHNGANTDEYNRAEVNGYYRANEVRDWALSANPEYPTIWNQLSFPVNVNINSSCNAYYNYSSINFFRAGGGCPNTAFSSVVHHEYTHHLVATGGSGQGQYGEGMSDAVGILILEDPIVGYGFLGDCNAGIRSADNAMQYPCNGAIHYCGQLLSGCIWSTRFELMITEPVLYREILRDLTINSILLHTGSMIDPWITVAFLVLDDDDGNLNNGTPHYWEIMAGFGAHNMGLTIITPTAVSASDGTYSDFVRVTWTGVTGATEYDVYRSTINSPSTAQYIGSVAASPYDDSTALPCTTYYYWVKARRGGLSSPFSTSDSGFRLPSAPTGVSASDGTFRNFIRVSWNALTTPAVTSYQVWRNTINDSSTATQIATVTVSPYDDYATVSGQYYWYWVKACGSCGCSGFSLPNRGHRGLVPWPEEQELEH